MDVHIIESKVNLVCVFQVHVNPWSVNDSQVDANNYHADMLERVAEMLRKRRNPDGVIYDGDQAAAAWSYAWTDPSQGGPQQSSVTDSIVSKLQWEEERKERLALLASMPQCGKSRCRMHWIDTGELCDHGE